MTLAQRVQQALAAWFGGNQQISNRNWFVDGRFDGWGSSPYNLTTVGSYAGALMWTASAGTGGAGTGAQYAMATDSQMSLLDSGPQFAYRFSQTTASTGTFSASTLPFMAQKVEDVRHFAGKSVTLSFKARSVSGNLGIAGFYANQNFGTGGSAVVVTSYPAAFKLTSQFKKYSCRIDLPSISSATIGTTTTFTNFGFMLDGVVGVVDFAEMQLEMCSPQSATSTTGAGGSPTAYEFRGEGPELARRYRYFQLLDISCRQGAYAANCYMSVGFNFPVQMVGAPAAGLNVSGGSSNILSSALTIQDALGCRFEIVSNTAGDCYILTRQYTLDARL